MTAKKWLRNDPDRPFPTDLRKIGELLKRYIAPTNEPLWFYRNKGTSSAESKWRQQNYTNLDNVEVMEQLGLYMPARCHFFKGAGLKHESESIAQIVPYAEEMHRRGMLVSVYVGGTIFTDYFFQEVPEAIDWVRRDQDGQPVTYGSYQLQRWFPCLNHPDYRAYTKRVLDVAIEQVGADAIFFDNQILRYEPRSCRCAHCVKHLREMIRRKYTLAQCEERYGFAEYPDVRPPIWSQACKPWRMDAVYTPQIQDWIDHRVETVVDFYREMAEHCRRQRADLTVGMNIKGLHGHNEAFDNGISHGAFADILDWTCIDGYEPGYRDGAIVSEVRLWKQGHSSHISVVDWYNEKDLSWVEDQVYGYRKKIEGHGWLGNIETCVPYNPLRQFLRGNQRLFHERAHLHDVAVLRAEPSTKYNCAKVQEQLMAFEQTLAVEKIPWGIIFDKQIDSLERHRIVALPEIQALSDKWLDRLDTFMRAGGGVIASGKAARFTEWYRPRDPEKTLARWLGHAPGANYETVEVGSGRLVYVPSWDVATRWDFDDWFAVWGKNLQPVKNRELFLRAIADASGGRPLTHRVTGNDCVWVEAIAAAGGVGQGLDLHFINYRPEQREPTLEVKVALPPGGNHGAVQLIDLEGDAPRKLPIQATVVGGCLCFNVFTPTIYAIAQISFDSVAPVSNEARRHVGEGV